MNNSWIITAVIVLMMILIVSSLAMGLYYLVKDKGDSKRTVRALTIRIGLSLILFLALILAFVMGWITPHSIFIRTP